MVQAGNAQHLGGRSSQQDAFGFSDPFDEAFCAHAGLLGVVADGMGGLPHGEAASRAAVRTMLNAYMRKSTHETVMDALNRSLSVAVADVQRLSANLGDIGTTLLAAAVTEHTLSWISVGDSVLLLLRGGRIRQLNRVHTYGERLAPGVMHPESESLTSYLGSLPPNQVDSYEQYPLYARDRVILCSDGLWKVVDNAEIATLALGDPQDASQRLVARSLEVGGATQDNVTVLIFCL